MMNWVFISLFMVQLWHSCTSQAQPNPTQIYGQPQGQIVTPKLTHRILQTMATNPWSAIFNNSYYLKTTLTQGHLTEYNKAVAHFALNDGMNTHKAWQALLAQGLNIVQASTDPFAVKVSLLFKELIANENLYGLDYIQKYSDPIIGPIPDCIKQLPVRADTQDYIQKLNQIGQSKKLGPILVAYLASNMQYEMWYRWVIESPDYKPNPLLPLLSYKQDNTTSLLLDKIGYVIDAHYEAGMTVDEQQLAIDTYDNIWGAECRAKYGNAFVEQMGAYVRQPGDSTPVLKQYFH